MSVDRDASVQTLHLKAQRVFEGGHLQRAVRHAPPGSGGASAEAPRLRRGARVTAALRNAPAVRPREHEDAVVGRCDSEAALVHERVVKAAERDEVRELRLAAIGPVLDVVALRETRAVAPREAAAAVARAQRALQSKRDAACLAADVQRLAVRTLDDADERAVAAEPSHRVERERRAVVELA